MAAARKSELSALWKMQVVYGINRSLSFVTTMLVSVASFGVYEALGNDLTVAKAFACLAYFRQIELAITMLPLAVDCHVQMKVATQRVDKFLHIAESGNENKAQTLPADGVAAKFTAASFTWALPSAPVKAAAGSAATETTAMNPEPEPAAGNCLCNCLRNLNLEFEAGQLHGIIGRVGSGKSSLIMSSRSMTRHPLRVRAFCATACHQCRLIGDCGSFPVLGETSLISGSVAIDGSVPIAFVPQQPWVLNSSVRDNVLMGAPYNEARYKAVISACDLDSDIARMQYGDDT